MIDQNQPADQQRLALWNLGFRPFFMGAAIFSSLAIAAWMLVYMGRMQLYPQGISITLWHAHEMLFGYALAVISGFLLTAVKNWTGIQTPHQQPLMLLFLLWVMARVAVNLGDSFLLIAALSDVMFNVSMLLAVTWPIIKTRQWKQMPIIGKLVLLTCLNALFYLDAFEFSANGAWFAVYGAFYTIIALILMMARRLIPFFVERGVPYDVKLKNSKMLDITSMVLLVWLMICELFTLMSELTHWLALCLFIIHLTRLYLWHTPGIWKKPLLWSLYLAYATLTMGFLVFALTLLLPSAKLLALHSFALGGVGLITVSMMARVSLGHSGRSIDQPPKMVVLCFALIPIAAIIRVLFPIIAPQHYLLWVSISGWLWVATFLLYGFSLAPIWLSPRVDGKYN